jgi:3-mercaptopyruvate sulfurtransferase SseA
MFTRNAIKLSAATMLGLAILAGGAVAQSASIYQGILAEPNAKTQEVSTEDVRRILADGSAILIDPRKRAEFVAGHIAGAKNVVPEPGAPPAAFVAAVERLASGDKSQE